MVDCGDERDLLFGPLPQDAGSVKLTLPDGTAPDAPARTVPGLPGKFFYLISPTSLRSNYGVALLDPQGRPVAI